MTPENADALDTFHCFGSRWFCLQMQEVFNIQSAMLGEIALKHQNAQLLPVLPLIHGLQTTSEAISLLRRDGLLTEAHLLMRLLTERAINLCYLLVTPTKEGHEAQKEVFKNASGAKDLSAPHDLVAFAKQFRFKETYDGEALETKINVVAANTKIPADFLRLLVASHYPQASLALSGSKGGATFHLHNLKVEAEDLFSDKFTVLFFSGLTLLNYVIKVLGQHGVPENLRKNSDTSAERAMRLWERSRLPVAANVQDSYGWWQTLSDAEYIAGKQLAPLLVEFDIAFGACVEAGMEAPMLAKRDEKSLRLNTCALYLKRMLNDVRSVWLMVRQGNTSQAGSIAASLFENALLIMCLAEDEPRATKFRDTPSGEWPWKKRAMCKMVNEDGARREKKTPDPKVSEAHYKQYSWLCEIKHGSLEYASYDSGSTRDEDRGYGVMPFPDVRKEDWPVKLKILLISLHNAVMAIQAFARAGSVKESSPVEIAFARKLKQVDDLLVKYIEQERLAKLLTAGSTRGTHPG